MLSVRHGKDGHHTSQLWDYEGPRVWLQELEWDLQDSPLWPTHGVLDISAHLADTEWPSTQTACCKYSTHFTQEHASWKERPRTWAAVLPGRFLHSTSLQGSPELTASLFYTISSRTSSFLSAVVPPDRLKAPGQDSKSNDYTHPCGVTPQRPENPDGALGEASW